MESIKKFKDKAALTKYIFESDVNSMTSEEFLNWLQTISFETEMQDNTDEKIETR